MACKLVVTRSAEGDLDKLLDHIVNKLCNIPAALRLLEEIEKRYELLTEDPNLYGLCQQPLLKAARYRKAAICGYIMLYRVDSEKNTVIIERFFSELEDYAEKL